MKNVMKKKVYIVPQVRKYSIFGSIALFAGSPRKNPVRVNGEDMFGNEVEDTDAKEADSRHYDGWNWED